MDTPTRTPAPTASPSRRTRRVGIIGLYHESNTFAPGLTTLEDFGRRAPLQGNKIAGHFRGGNHEISGFLETLEENGIEAVPLLYASAAPGPTVAAETLETLWGWGRKALRGAGPLDGILVAPHGAGVSERHRDMDGWWLGELRREVGPDMPLIGTLDPHSNLSFAMVAAADALLPYRTNPHIDQRPRGSKAAELMVRTLRGEIRPVQRCCLPPMLINIEKQYTGADPLLPLVRLCAEAEKRPGILDAAILLGFPYADVAELGSGVLVVADGDAAAAKNTALGLGRSLWEARASFQPAFVSPEQALARVAAGPRPACLLDMGDNIGGGAFGDGTWILQARGSQPELRIFACVCDPAAAKKAGAAGVGARLELALGGQAGPAFSGPPYAFRGRVRSIPPEIYTEEKPRHGAQKRFDTGTNALLESDDGRTIIRVTSQRMSPNSLNLLLSCGLRPGDFDAIVAKGVNGPVAAYEEVCPALLRVNTPGITSADMSHFTFHSRPVPLYPFEQGGEVAWAKTLGPPAR